MDIVQDGLKGRSPKNKKQIGRIGKKDKIYIEDYAVTYLYQIARSTEHKSGLAGLFGTCREVEGNKEYYIYAAIYQESENVPQGGLPREAVQKIMRQKGEVFPEYFFLGWAFVFNEAMGTMWESCYRSRLETLMGKPDLLMTIKKSTCEEHFYLYPTEMPQNAEGYFIFYEQNDAMQNFLINWHDEIKKPRCDEEGDQVAESCRNYYKEKRAAKMRARLAGGLVTAAALLLIFCTGVGIQNLNQYDKIQEVGQTLDVVNDMNSSAELENNNYYMEETFIAEEDSEPAVMQEPVSETFFQNEVSQDVVVEQISYGNEFAKFDEEEISETSEIEEVSEEYIEENNSVETIVAEQQEEIESNEILNIQQEYVTYEVSKGDTLYGICIRYYGNLSKAKEICDLNGIENKDNILFGQKILLPE